uniref:Secreted protein n=1 Tax=Phakopsora pachyrhizi TaxID=170000 RepID=A0A0S1MKM7_PHAPC
MAYSLILKRFILLLATYPAVLALKVDSPAEGASWNLSMPSTVSWSEVTSDPTYFDIILVNNNPSTYCCREQHSGR